MINLGGKLEVWREFESSIFSQPRLYQRCRLQKIPVPCSEVQTRAWSYSITFEPAVVVHYFPPSTVTWEAKLQREVLHLQGSGGNPWFWCSTLGHVKCPHQTCTPTHQPLAMPHVVHTLQIWIIFINGIKNKNSKFISFVEYNAICFSGYSTTHMYTINKQTKNNPSINLESFDFFLNNPEGQLFYFFWCMKVSMESSSAFMNVVWWMGDWTPDVNNDVMMMTGVFRDKNWPVYLEAKLLSLYERTSWSLWPSQVWNMSATSKSKG